MIEVEERTNRLARRLGELIAKATDGKGVAVGKAMGAFID